MKFKDIVNRGIVNLENCESEPIHIPGSIQPHGFLIAVRLSTDQIDFCSGNISEFLPVTYAQLLDTSFESFFGSNHYNAFKSYTATGLASSPMRITLHEARFDCTIRKTQSHVIIEAEPVDAAHSEQAAIYDQTSRFLTYMHETHTLQQLCQLVAEGTREITGYDRVMVYRFDKDYNGEVFAESVDEKLEPFLGLHYPHTDIPVQARELYMKNLLRLIVDIGYTPVPLYTVDDAPDKNLDLSLSVLRSTSPIHIQYLQNIGVSATLTISLLHKKRLWGLITCHHYSPKNLPPHLRLAAQLQGHFITSQIEVRQSNEEYAVAKKSNAAFEKLTAMHGSHSESILTSVIQSAEILGLCNATGVSIVFRDRVYKAGRTPTDHDILKISGQLAAKAHSGSLITDHLSALRPDADELCTDASGVIYHSLGRDTNNSIVWYRPETLSEVHWGGDPNKAIIKDENGLSPRNSFKLWSEIVKCKSAPWLVSEITAAANYAHALELQINLILLGEEEKRNRELNVVLKENNSELENINWISTHDLQEPLRKIQLISSRILSDENDIDPADVMQSLKKMNLSAKRMQMLLIDILKYTKIRHTEESFEAVALGDVAEKVASGLQDHSYGKNAVVTIGKLPAISGNSFLLEQLFSNLLNNAVKYAKDSVRPEIAITASALTRSPLDADNTTLYHRIDISDNGIGFEPDFNDSIFRIFTRLGNPQDNEGSGVGLALCRKIMQNHGGFITASGIPDKGAVFSLFFPVKNAAETCSIDLKKYRLVQAR